MGSELHLSFPDKDHVAVRLDGEDSGVLPFQTPLTTKDHQDLRWYLETYGAHSLGNPDDQEAKRNHDLLPVWGKALFDAVFKDRSAQRLFNLFQDDTGDARLLTIGSAHPSILGVPWELLHDSATGGVFDAHGSLPQRLADRAVTLGGWVTGRSAYNILGFGLGWTHNI